MSDKKSLYLMDSSMSANDLHDIIIELYDIHNVQDMELGVEEIIENYSDVEEEYIKSKSYDLKRIMLVLESEEGIEGAEEWDDAWSDVIVSTNYMEFVEIASSHRNTFQSIRAAYLMNQVGFKTLKEAPKTFGILQLVAEKYIMDLFQTEDKHTVTYEDFDGNVCSIKARYVKPDEYDILEAKPENHWVGKTIFDSFYMMSFYNDDTKKWEYIPVDLIRSIKVVFPGPNGGRMWGGNSGEDNGF